MDMHEGLKIRRGQPHGGSIPPPGTIRINDLGNQRILGCVFLCPNCAQTASLLRFPLVLELGAIQ
jgi:hypothetical protein